MSEGSTKLNELTVTQARALLAKHEISSVELVDACLSRIEAIEPRIQAWVVVDDEGARAAARERDRAYALGSARVLEGIPIGIKDIYLTAGLPTAAGFPPLADYQPGPSAAAVERLEQAGAIILGKTVTTQWAQADPSKTFNPWHLDHTPGGSSAGSAAGVAARMMPAALGSQTGGSVLRPAAYCGVIGLKPTFGRISLRNVFPLAWSLDHAGFMVRSVEDCGLLLSVLAGYDPADPGSSTESVGDYRRAATSTGPMPHVAVLRNCEEHAQPAAWAHFRDTIGLLERAGAQIEERDFPGGLAAAYAVHHTIMQSEAAAIHAERYAAQAADYAPRFRSYLEVGHLIPAVDYLRAQQLRRGLRAAIQQTFEGVDALIMPTVSGPAPDRSTTGDTSFQAIWSLLGLPTLTIPSGLSADGLPYGLQIIAAPFAEERLLQVGRPVEAVLPPIGAPAC